MDTGPDRIPVTRTFKPISSDKLSEWLISVEGLLQNICSIVAEGKLNTEQKLNINSFCRSIQGSASQISVHYQTLKQNFLLCKEKLEHLADKHDLCPTMDDIKYLLENPQEVLKKPEPSFADMVRKGADIYIKPKPTSFLTIFPKNKDESSEDTKNLIQNIIRHDVMKIQVRNIRKIRNGGVLINTESKEDISKIKMDEKLASSGLTIEEPSKRSPRIIKFGVPSALSEKEFFDCLFEQNVANKLPNVSKEKFMSGVKFSHKSSKKKLRELQFYY